MRPQQAIPLNDPSRLVASMGARLREVADRVLASGRYILGTEVLAFEAEFARHVGAPHAIGVGNGTDALEIALRACGVEAGNGVLTCANAGGYAATAARAIGAIPVFADIDDSGLANVDTMERAFTSAPAPPRAAVVTHLYGRVCNMPALCAWARDRRLRLVEDCAQAHGAHAHGVVAGTSGDAAAFSFYPTKNLGALGDAGLVLTGDADVAQRARALREYGWGARYRVHAAGGRNSRLDELQAGFLREMLPLLERRNARRRAIATRYSAAITHASIELPPPPAAGEAAHLYVVRSHRRDALASHLSAAGVGCAIHYPVPDHRQPAVHTGNAHADLPTTDAWCDTVLSLPCFPELDDAEVEAVIAACNRWPG